MVRGNNFATAGLEMACWDLHTRSERQPLARALSGTRREILSGVSLGIEPTVKAIVEQVARFLDQGYRRIKMKIGPGRDLAYLRAVRERWPEPPNYYEPLVTLTAVATATSRIRVGTCVIVVPLREPVLLAKQIATLDVFSHGRLIFGVGVGAYREEFEATYPGRTQDNRGAIHEEGLEALTRLFRDRRASFNGRYLHFEDIELYPKPVQNPLPMWTSGNTRVAAERAGRTLAEAVAKDLRPRRILTRHAFENAIAVVMAVGLMAVVEIDGVLVLGVAPFTRALIIAVAVRAGVADNTAALAVRGVAVLPMMVCPTGRRWGAAAKRGDCGWTPAAPSRATKSAASAANVTSITSKTATERPTGRVDSLQQSLGRSS